MLYSNPFVETICFVQDSIYPLLIYSRIKGKKCQQILKIVFLKNKHRNLYNLNLSYNIMNKDKLISLIVKKQTYRDTKPTQNDIAKKKEEAVNVSISAIHQILKDQYNAEAKLYAARFLKDCFEKGNPAFISKTQTKILPILYSIVKDSKDENKIMNYAGNSFSKNTELEKFKSLVSSLFVYCRQCIQNWGRWIPDPNRRFLQIRNKLNEEIPYDYGNRFQYFRPQHYLIFKQNCQKNGLNLPPLLKVAESNSKIDMKEEKKETSGAFKKKDKKIQKILQEIQKKIAGGQKMDGKSFAEFEGELNIAVNEYIQRQQQFDEKYLQNCFQKFENFKKQAKKASKKLKQKNQESQKKEIEAKTHKKENKSVSQVSEKSRNIKIEEQQPGKSKYEHQNLPVGSKFSPSVMKPDSSVRSQSRVRFDESSQFETEKSSRPVENSYVQQQQTRGKDTAQYNFKKGKRNQNIDKNIKVIEEEDQSKFQRQQSQLQKLVSALEKVQGEKKELQNLVTSLHQQIVEKRESQQKMKQMLKNTVSKKQLELIHKDRTEQKKEKDALYEEIRQLKIQMGNMQKSMREKTLQIQQLLQQKQANAKLKQKPQNQEKQRAEKYQAEVIHKSQAKNKKENDYIIEQENGRKKVNANEEISPRRIDPDYINNQTHFSNIESWMSKSNVVRFKRCLLGSNKIFFEEQGIKIFCSRNSFSKQGGDYVKLNIEFEFDRRQRIPKTTYRSIQEIDLWKKPIVGEGNKYSQEMVGKICGNPLKLIKSSISLEGNRTINFFLPVLYFNFLATRQFQKDQFESILQVRKANIVRSKVFILSQYLQPNLRDISPLLKESVHRENYLEFCLCEESSENVFMVQIQILKNQKALIRVLPIPSSSPNNQKAKELINDLVFLLSE